MDIIYKHASWMLIDVQLWQPDFSGFSIWRSYSNPAERVNKFSHETSQHYWQFVSLEGGCELSF